MAVLPPRWTRRRNPCRCTEHLTTRRSPAVGLRRSQYSRWTDVAAAQPPSRGRQHGSCRAQGSMARRHQNVHPTIGDAGRARTRSWWPSGGPFTEGGLMRGTSAHRTFPTALRSCGRGVSRLRLPALVIQSESHRSSGPEGFMAVMITIHHAHPNRYIYCRDFRPGPHPSPLMFPSLMSGTWLEHPRCGPPPQRMSPACGG